MRNGSNWLDKPQEGWFELRPQIGGQWSSIFNEKSNCQVLNTYSNHYGRRINPFMDSYKPGKYCFESEYKELAYADGGIIF